MIKCNWWNYMILQSSAHFYINVSILQSLNATSKRFPSHLRALQQWKKRKEETNQGLIDPKRHFIHSASRQPSLFSKESTLSCLHSSGASLPRPDELCRLYLPKQGSSLTGTQHFTRWFWLPADLSGEKKVSESNRIEPSVRDEMSRVGFRNLQVLLKSSSRLWGLLKI